MDAVISISMIGFSICVLSASIFILGQICYYKFEKLEKRIQNLEHKNKY